MKLKLCLMALFGCCISMFSKEYFPKNDGIIAEGSGYMAFKSATAYVSPSSKIFKNRPSINIFSDFDLSGDPGKKTIGKTEIEKWQNGKKAAVSLTYDDSTINHFKVAVPLMDKLGFPGTFYVITGAVPGSEYEPKFVGRPVEDIIKETENIPTNKDNFYERASAIRFSGYEGPYEYHNQAHVFYSKGDLEKAYKVIDKGYQKIREGAFGPDNGYMDELYNVLAIDDPEVSLVTWPELRKHAQRGHEFGSHTILHPFLAVMDSINIAYELEKSKQDLLTHLGPEHTFSAECPFGTEDERVMSYAHRLFPALRNDMQHPYLETLNRANKKSPLNTEKEYVQWQRGPLSDTSMELMKSWVDTSLEQDNTWLVLVFHGIEGIGWEPLTKAELEEYFSYIKEKEDRLWVATFRDVTKYMRERMNAEVQAEQQGDKIRVKLTHSLDKDLYQLPLTLKTYVPSDWETVTVSQNDKTQQINTQKDKNGTFIRYQARANNGPVWLNR